jgi:RpiR family carbohydrate utilization transcriptional regulator
MKETSRKPGRSGGRTPQSHLPAQGLATGVVARLQGMRDGLGPASGRIADFIVNNPNDVIHMSVTELAERAGVSEGSVVGLCRQVGLNGFQHLKIGLAQELVRPVQFIHEDLGRDDTTGDVIEKIVRSDIQALLDTQSVLDPGSVQQAVAAIRDAERVEIYGIGSAATVAEDAHYRLLRIGINCKAELDSHRQAISAALTGPGVATLTFSHSGSSRETVEATRLAKLAGARTVCVTNFGKSPIHAHADIVLHTMATETRFRTEAMSSRIAQLCIVDILIACLALADYDDAVDTIKRTFDVLSLKRW